MKEKRLRDKRYWKENILLDWKTIFLTVGLFWKNEFKSEKKGLKPLLVRIFSYLVVFAVLTELSSVFFSLCARLNIFSVFSFVPLSVVSLLTEAIFYLGFISALIDSMKILYFSDSGKSMLTLPCNGNTLFFSNLIFFYLKECLKTMLIEIPFVLGFMLASGYPLFYFAFPILMWFLFVLFEVGIVSVLSVPSFYVVRFLKKHLSVSALLVLGGLSLLIYLTFRVLSLIPDRVDIFANWGPYFTSIQNVLRFYINHFSFSYGMTQLALGDYTGFTIVPFGGVSMRTLYIILGCIFVCFVLTLVMVHPVYFSIVSSESGGLIKEKENIRKEKESPFIIELLKKEMRLVLQKPGMYLSSLAVFAFLPVYITLLNKIFGAMDTNDFGEILIQVFNILIILLVAFNSNLNIADSYLSEKRALSLNKTYPRSQGLLLLTKLLIPGLMGITSICASLLIYCHFKDIPSSIQTMLIFGLVFYYLGHLLFASGLGFGYKNVSFGNEKEENDNMKLVTLSSFLLAILISLIYYLTLNEDSFSSALKLLITGLIFFSGNILLCYHKIEFLFMERE
jgi:hypothetical protein